MKDLDHDKRLHAPSSVSRGAVSSFRQVCQNCHTGKSVIQSTLATLLLIWCAASLFGCASADPGDPPASSCVCTADQVCVDDVCRQRCQTDGDCSVGRTCQEGACISDTSGVCSTDADCPGGQCVEGQCFVRECEDGDSRACSTECGEGQEVCRNGVFVGCNAPVPRLEVCGDNQDNNCNGQIDENCEGCTEGEERECMTECGTGRERCLGGSWRGCTAERPQPADICGNEVDDDCNGAIDDGCDNCEDGETRTCLTSCGSGEERCENNTFLGCTAPTPQDEVCDGEDNDCDGDVDEEIVRDCTNACGTGLETCESGTWVQCTAPESCNCPEDNAVDLQVCGQCGFRERVCDGFEWGEWGACSEGGQCEPGEEETRACGNCGTSRRVCTAECTWGDWQECKGEKACEAGTKSEEACGTCGGLRQRACSDSCEWEGWGECSVPPGSACAPGETEERPCDRCGVQIRTCGEDCQWGDWGGCGGQGACEPGEEDARSCGGSCQAQVRTCSNSCEWEDWGECSGGGQCTPGQRETGECGSCGERSRICSSECIWEDWGSCSGGGICEPGESEEEVCGDSDVGACSFGVRTRTCGDACGWGSWGACDGAVGPTNDVCGDGIDSDCDGQDARDPDQYEPNDGCNSAHSLGVDPENMVIQGTIDTAADRDDYYYFDGDDGFSILGRESIVLMLTNIPAGADYDLFLYKGLESCLQDTPAETSSAGSGQDESLEWFEGLNEDDTDRYYIRIKRFSGNACFNPYRLTVDGLN